MKKYLTAAARIIAAVGLALVAILIFALSCHIPPAHNPLVTLIITTACFIAATKLGGMAIILIGE